jgi:ferredoxin/flavodoxin---NADP+ reductase
MPEPTPRHLVQSLRWLDPSTFVLRIDRNDLQFKAGQCISLGRWNAGVNREYSVYSGEHEPYLELLIKAIKGGTVSPALAVLRPRDPVYVAGPYSDFVLGDDTGGKKFVFVATGTGIAPFHAFVTSRPGLDYSVIHGVRELAHCYDRTVYAPERYVACVSRERCDAFHGRVTDYLNERPLPADTHVYLCGNHTMIEDAFDVLRAQGIASDRIHAEVFF